MSCPTCTSTTDLSTCPPDDGHWVGTDCCSTGSSSGGSEGGGGIVDGGTHSGIEITGSTFTGGTIADSTITNPTITGGSMSGTAVSGGSVSGTTIATSTLIAPTVTSPTVSSGAFSAPAITGGTISGAAISGGSLTGVTISGLTNPSLPGDPATKEYVDSLSTSGLQIKIPVRVATTANVTTLAGGAPKVVDGITLIVGDRVLVKDQSTKTQNGIYEVGTLGSGSNGTWTRTLDADAGGELENAYVFVDEGTANAGSSWVQTATPVTIGVTELVWTLYYRVAAVPASNIVGQLVSAQIEDLAINTAKFAATIKPVELVSSLPSTDLVQGRIVFLTTDSKLYRYTGTAWTAAIPSVDVTGTFGPDSIETAAITAAKLSDNAVTANKIAAGAVVAGKIAANAVTATEIAAGAITAIKIAANSITSNELAANSVIAGKIAAGAISATEIAVGAVSETRISNGAISTAKIGAGQIYGYHIYAGQITSDKITVGNLATINPNLGTVTAGLITANTQVDVGSGYNRTQITSTGLSAANGQLVFNSNAGSTGGQFRFGSSGFHYGTITAIAGTLCTFGMWGATGALRVSIDSSGAAMFGATTLGSLTVTDSAPLLPGIRYTSPGGYSSNAISVVWDGANSRAGIFVDGVLKVILPQNV